MDRRHEKDWTSVLHHDQRVARARMQVIVAEVSATIDARVNEQVKRVRRVSDDLRTLADMCQQFRELVSNASEIELLVPFVFRVVEGFSAFIETDFRPAFERFIGEHGAHVDGATQERIAEFFPWAKAARDDLRSRCKTIARNLEEGLRHASSEITEIATVWSRVDGDGLEHAEQRPA